MVIRRGLGGIARATRTVAAVLKGVVPRLPLVAFGTAPECRERNVLGQCSSKPLTAPRPRQSVIVGLGLVWPATLWAAVSLLNVRVSGIPLVASGTPPAGLDSGPRW